jgi:hypothetical protein
MPCSPVLKSENCLDLVNGIGQVSGTYQGEHIYFSACFRCNDTAISGKPKIFEPEDQLF